LVVTFFNMFSGIFTTQFNSLASTMLGQVDPFFLNYTRSVPLGSYPVGSCDSFETTANFVIDSLSGMSTVEILELEMLAFGPSCMAFEFEAVIANLTADFEGEILGEGCSIELDQNFTGLAQITDVDFVFGFSANYTFGDLSFSLNELNITHFDLSWTSLTVDFSDLGSFNAAAETLSTTLVAAGENAIDTLVNATVLQNAVDLIVPLTIP